jgi:hypothetical protein
MDNIFAAHDFVKEFLINAKAKIMDNMILFLNSFFDFVIYKLNQFNIHFIRIFSYSNFYENVTFLQNLVNFREFLSKGIMDRNAVA